MNWETILVGAAILIAGYKAFVILKQILADLSAQQRNSVRRHELRALLDATNVLRKQTEFLFDRASPEIMAYRDLGDIKVDQEVHLAFSGEVLRLADFEHSIRRLEVSLSFCEVFAEEKWFQVCHKLIEEAQKVAREFRAFIEERSSADNDNENLKMAALDYAISSGKFPYGNGMERAAAFQKYFSRVEDGVTSQLGWY